MCDSLTAVGDPFASSHCRVIARPAADPVIPNRRPDGLTSVLLVVGNHVTPREKLALVLHPSHLARRLHLPRDHNRDSAEASYYDELAVDMTSREYTQ